MTLWEVESIVEAHGKGSNRLYRVRWVGFGPESDSWLEAADFQDNELVDEFENPGARDTDSEVPEDCSEPGLELTAPTGSGEAPSPSVIPVEARKGSWSQSKMAIRSFPALRKPGNKGKLTLPDSPLAPLSAAARQLTQRVQPVTANSAGAAQLRFEKAVRDAGGVVGPRALIEYLAHMLSSGKWQPGTAFTRAASITARYKEQRHPLFLEEEGLMRSCIGNLRKLRDATLARQAPGASPCLVRRAIKWAEETKEDKLRKHGHTTANVFKYGWLAEALTMAFLFCLRANAIYWIRPGDVRYGANAAGDEEYFTVAGEALKGRPKYLPAAANIRDLPDDIQRILRRLGRRALAVRENAEYLSNLEKELGERKDPGRLLFGCDNEELLRRTLGEALNAVRTPQEAHLTFSSHSLRRGGLMTLAADSSVSPEDARAHANHAVASEVHCMTYARSATCIRALGKSLRTER